MHHPKITSFLLVFFSLSLPATAGTLRAGDIQIPSKVVIRISGGAQSAQDVKQQTRDAFHKLTPEFLKKSQSAQWNISLDVVHNPHELSHHAICQEYVAYQLQPRMRAVRPNVKILTVDVKKLDGNTKSCRFDVKKRLYLLPSRSMPNLGIGRKFKKIVVDGFGIVPVALLAHSKRLDATAKTIEFLVVVPFALSDRPRLITFLSTAAREIYTILEKVAKRKGITKNKTFIIQLTAVPRGKREPRFGLPGITILAFRDGKSDILLVSKMQYRLFRMHKVGDTVKKKIPPREFLSVTLLSENANVCLSKETIRQAGAKSSADCVKIVANSESKKALTSFAQHAAEQYDVNEIQFLHVVQTKEPTVGLRWPTRYRHVGDKWEVMSTQRTPALP